MIVIQEGRHSLHFHHSHSRPYSGLQNLLESLRWQRRTSLPVGSSHQDYIGDKALGLLIGVLWELCSSLTMVEEGQQSMLHHLQVAHELAEQVAMGSAYKNNSHQIYGGQMHALNRLVCVATNLFELRYRG